MKKKKKYKPKGVRLDVMGWLLQGYQPVSSHDAILDLRIKNHSALTAITQGRATRDDIDAMIHALNITEALSIVNPKLGTDWKDEIAVAQNALYEMAKRGIQRNDHFIFTGPEMKAVNEAMAIHEAQLDAARVIDVEKATNLVVETIRSRRARQISP